MSNALEGEGTIKMKWSIGTDVECNTSEWTQVEWKRNLSNDPVLSFCIVSSTAFWGDKRIPSNAMKHTKSNSKNGANELQHCHHKTKKALDDLGMMQADQTCPWTSSSHWTLWGFWMCEHFAREHQLSHCMRCLLSFILLQQWSKCIWPFWQLKSVCWVLWSWPVWLVFGLKHSVKWHIAWSMRTTVLFQNLLSTQGIFWKWNGQSTWLSTASFCDSCNWSMHMMEMQWKHNWHPAVIVDHHSTSCGWLELAGWQMHNLPQIKLRHWPLRMQDADVVWKQGPCHWPMWLTRASPWSLSASLPLGTQSCSLSVPICAVSINRSRFSFDSSTGSWPDVLSQYPTTFMPMTMTEPLR